MFVGKNLKNIWKNSRVWADKTQQTGSRSLHLLTQKVAKNLACFMNKHVMDIHLHTWEINFNEHPSDWKNHRCLFFWLRNYYVASMVFSSLPWMNVSVEELVQELFDVGFPCLGNLVNLLTTKTSPPGKTEKRNKKN